MILEEIKERIDFVAETYKDKIVGSKIWTKSLLSALVSCGNDSYYTCCSNYKKGFEGMGEYPNAPEWLYDLCWIDLISEPNKWDFLKFKKIKLILESEWGNKGDINDDYLKLIPAKAENKVMIFQENTIQRVKDKINELEAAAKNLRGIEDEHYLLACYQYETRNFVFHQFIVPAHHNKSKDLKD
jgi:hypothetical protein